MTAKKRKPAKRRGRAQESPLRRLQAVRPGYVVDVRLVDYVERGVGSVILVSDLARYLEMEMQRVVEIRQSLADLPSAARPTGSVL